MTDVLLNPCGDIDITDGRLTIVGGADAVRQRWLIYIRTFLGEWFLDTTIGVPFVQSLFTKAISRQTIKQIFTTATLEVPGILQVVSVIVDSLNVATRFAEVTVTCVIDGAEGPETGEFRFTGVIPVGGCKPVVEVPETVEDLLFWFDASYAPGVILNVPDTSLEFQSRVGQGKLVGVDGAAGSPRLLNSVINGLPAVRLFGATQDDHLSIQGVQAIRSNLGFDGSFTFFQVFKWTDESLVGQVNLWVLDGVQSDGTTQEWYAAFAPTSPVLDPEQGMGILSRTTGGPFSQYFDGGFAVTPAWAATDVMARVWRRDFSVAPPHPRALFQQGLLLNASADSQPTLRQLNGLGVIGAQFNFTTGLPEAFNNGFWCETICYSRALTDDEVDTVNDYLLAKWGITKPTPV